MLLGDGFSSCDGEFIVVFIISNTTEKKSLPVLLWCSYFDGVGGVHLAVFTWGCGIVGVNLETFLVLVVFNLGSLWCWWCLL